MNRDLKNIDKLFQDNLSGAGDQPPMHIWEGIENALDVADAKIISNKKQKRNRYAIAAIFLFATGVSAWLWSTNRTEINPVAVTQTNSAAIVSTENKTGQQTINPAEQQQIQQAQTAEEKIKIDKVNSLTTSLNEFNTNDKMNVVVKTTPVNSSIIPAVENVIPEAHEKNLQPALNSSQLAQTVDIYRAGQQLTSLPETLPFTNIIADAKSIAAVVKIKKQSRFSITAFFAPDITTRNLAQNFGSTIDEKKEEIRRTEKTSQFDFTFGARVEYKLNKHLSLASGLSFSTNTIDIIQKTVFARFDKDGLLKFRFNLSSGYAYFKPKTLSAPQFLGDSAQALSSSSTLHYINIPLTLKYNIASGRFNFSAQAGLMARFITKQSIDAVYASNGANEKSRTNEIQGLKTSYFNGMVGIGVDYALSKTVALTVFPSFNFATTSINRDAPVKAYPNTLSIATGVKFSL